MNNKTYHKMTKKRSLRGLRLFAQKYFTKQRFYSFLAKINLVREVKHFSHSPILNNEFINKVRLLEDKIVTDRGIFNLSFHCIGETHLYQWWYESIFKPHKKLYVISDEKFIYVEAQVRSQCEEFEVRIDPFNHIRVPKQHCTVFLHQPAKPKSFLLQEELKFVAPKKWTVDLLKARLGTKVTLKVNTEGSTIEDTVKECVQKATVQLRNYIEGNSEAINEMITGVKADGEFISHDGQRLLPNTICHKCGSPVFKSSVDGYVAQCIVCDEDLYGIETCKLDPKVYEKVYEGNKTILYDILTN